MRGRSIRSLVVLLLVAACSGPNLDEAVPDLDAAAIRPRIEIHGDRIPSLTADDLELLAVFLERYAGEGPGAAPSEDLGRMLWRRSGCAACHVMAAGQD